MSELWTAAVAFVLKHLVNPVLACTGLVGIVSDPTGMAELLLIGVAQVFVIGLVFLPFEKFAAWVMHRLQHKFAWWWALHSLHHSQRQMTRWTDDRGNIIDSVLQSIFVGAWGLIIGVAPVEYGLISFLGKMVENLSHANTRFGFGPIVDKLLVDPRFHRQHHMMADPTNPDLHNCNFGVVFPFWDILFGTALYDGKVRPTGLDDAESDANNMLGWWGQQVASTQRLFRAFGLTVRPTANIPISPMTNTTMQTTATRDSAPVA